MNKGEGRRESSQREKTISPALNINVSWLSSFRRSGSGSEAIE